MKITLERISDNGVQTLGYLKDGNGNILAHTLELAWKDNRKRVSCIPKGVYKVVKRFSPKYKDHFHVTDVKNRDWILIHNANYHFQLLGCIAVGSAHIDINKDGLKDVTASVAKMAELNKILPSEFELTIK